MPEERRRLRQGGRAASWPTACSPADRAEDADLVVVNTCAFIEAARQESIDTVLALADARKAGAKLVVTGCMAERYGDELAAALPEVDAVVGFAGEGALADVGVAVPAPKRKPTGVRDLLELPRPAPSVPVGVREGRRGLRPRLRVLRHPVVPRQAALAHARVDRGRGARPGRRRRRRDRARRAGPRLVRARRREPGLARAAAAAARHARPRRPGADPPPLPLSRARCATRSSPPCSSCRRSCPYFDLSLQHADAALLRAHEAVGERRPLPRRDRRHPRAGARRGVPVVVHRRLPR